MSGEVFASHESLELVLPEAPNGIGNLILQPEAAGLIAGVKVKPFPIWPDDRGYFLEIARVKQGLVTDFNPETTQVSAALSYPGTIKAFHFHLHQTDFWVPAVGMFQFALVDLRKGSPTFGLKNTMYVGSMRPWHVIIPPGVGHGYKVVGQEAGILVYVTDRIYNPKDEGRIPYDHGGVNYDWETQHK